MTNEDYKKVLTAIKEYYDFTTFGNIRRVESFENYIKEKIEKEEK